MAQLFESSRGFIRALLERIKKIVAWLAQSRPHYFGRHVANASVIAALLRSNKEDEKAGCFDDRLVWHIKDRFGECMSVISKGNASDERGLTSLTTKSTQAMTNEDKWSLGGQPALRWDRTLIPR